jgi:hypothetical protein
MFPPPLGEGEGTVGGEVLLCFFEIKNQTTVNAILSLLVSKNLQKSTLKINI